MTEHFPAPTDDDGYNDKRMRDDDDSSVSHHRRKCTLNELLEACVCWHVVMVKGCRI